MIDMYGKCGEIGFSNYVFKKMEQKTVASWSIAAHANLGMWDRCLEILGEMNSKSSCKAEESVLVSVLSACTHLGGHNLGRSTHGFLTRSFLGLNVTVETSLIDMYVKCGFLSKGSFIFKRMAKKNQLSYSVMISGLALYGCGLEALELFNEMLNSGVKPDDITFIGVLTACSHAGLVEEGLQFLGSMRFKHKIEPTIQHYGCIVDLIKHKIEPTIQHYGCIVDLMGRAGRVNEAYEFIKDMPFEPNDVIWRSLLSCKIHQNVEMGEIAARNLFQMHSHNAGDYVMLSNIYAKAQRWDDVAKIRTEIVNRGLIRTPGTSLLKLGRNLYNFVSQDTKYPQCEGLYEILYHMDLELKSECFGSDTSQVLFDVDEEEKRERLRGHRSLQLPLH